MGSKCQYLAKNGQKCIFWTKFGRFWAEILIFLEREQKFGTHISVNQHFLEKTCKLSWKDLRTNWKLWKTVKLPKKSWKSTFFVTHMQKVLIFVTHMSPKWPSWESDQISPQACTMYMTRIHTHLHFTMYTISILIITIIMIIMIFMTTTTKQTQFNTTQLQKQIYPPGATLRELCQPDLLAVPVARAINAL